MAIFKCKMCGGTLEINGNETVAECQYCGTKQTIPRLNDDRRASLYDRASHFRRSNDFGKALSIYEQILNEDSTDAEAYWSLVLCRYGIEYVEDPATHKRVPTVNRAQFTSIFADEDYKSALQYADDYQKSIYEEEAKAIDEIQKGILAISQKEEPFDVFICYKETDNNGRRTQESVLANDLYHQLTQEGFKVFFSRITLEDKLGSAYEPYIFAALNSAKVMVVIGTRPENFQAVWVKNEWSRFLALMKKDSKKALIPAYRDMDPYDLPEEFAYLQAQDMSKLGFMQDLLRGIKKIIGSEETKETAAYGKTAENASASTDPLLRRAFMFLEDGNWQEANEYCEKVLDQDPENAMAYLGKLMADLKVCRREDLKDCPLPFDENSNYEKALRFADIKLAEELKKCNTYINERNKEARQSAAYNNAVNAMENADTAEKCLEAAEKFSELGNYRDAQIKADECLEKAEACRKDFVYEAAKRKMSVASISSYEKAIEFFEEIRGWRDADEQINLCYQEIKKIKEDTEREAKHNRKISFIVVPITCIVFAIIILAVTIIIPTYKYNNALALMDKGNVVEAYESLIALDGYKDSSEIAASIFDKYKVEKIKAAEVGDNIFFGTYEQDKNTANGKEDIEWLVIDKKEGKTLIISKYALDCQPYNDNSIDTTWEECSLRKWLNGTFLNNAFSTEEQAKIAETSVSADKNPKHSTNSGNSTTDKVFLLSINEAEKYFGNDETRKCAPTEYAEAQGLWLSDSYTVGDKSTCWWYLRSPGDAPMAATDILYDGSVNYRGEFSDLVGGVRPAMWISLSE